MKDLIRKFHLTRFHQARINHSWITLVDDKILIMDSGEENNQILFVNAFNLNTGDLLWSSIEDVSFQSYRTQTNITNQSNWVILNSLVLNDRLFRQFENTVAEIDMREKPTDRLIQKKDVLLHLGKTYSRLGQFENADTVLSSIITTLDQQNSQARLALSDVYLQMENKQKDFNKTLVDYYDLISPESPQGMNTIEKLKEQSGLTWQKPFSTSHYSSCLDKVSSISDDQIYFNVFTCKGSKPSISAYRQSTGTRIWNKNNLTFDRIQAKTQDNIHFI